MQVTQTLNKGQRIVLSVPGPLGQMLVLTAESADQRVTYEADLFLARIDPETSTLQQKPNAGAELLPVPSPAFYQAAKVHAAGCECKKLKLTKEEAEQLKALTLARVREYVIAQRAGLNPAPLFPGASLPLLVEKGFTLQNEGTGMPHLQCPEGAPSECCDKCYTDYAPLYVLCGDDETCRTQVTYGYALCLQYCVAV